jgi:hypothetical protein
LSADAYLLELLDITLMPVRAAGNANVPPEDVPMGVDGR